VAKVQERDLDKAVTLLTTLALETWLRARSDRWTVREPVVVPQSQAV